MSTVVRVQLSVMMFIQFFIWGSWFVTLGTYLTALNFEGAQIGAAYSTTGWGAIIAPLVAGMIADRFFRAEVVMGILHLVGAGLLYYASTITDAGMMFWVLIAYGICYMPTLGLVNAISFNQMDDPGQEFGVVRAFGTLGWIVAGLLIGYVLVNIVDGVEATAIPMQMAAVSSLVMGIYSFTLPKTPPKSAGQSQSFAQMFGLDAIKLLRDRSFLIFVIGSLLVCIPLGFYYGFANAYFNSEGMANAAGKMTFGQMSEALFLLIMPFFFKRLGIKYMLMLGMLAWVVRYVLFAYGDGGSMIWLLYGGIILHGICYDFFFVTGQIYVDKEAPKEIQASAQGFIALITYGVGSVIGANVSGQIVSAYTDADGVINWETVWLIPAGMALVVLILFALLFKNPDHHTNGEEAA